MQQSRWSSWAIRVARGLVLLLAASFLVQLAIRIWVLLWPWPTPPLFAPLLASSARRRYRDPVATLAQLGIEPGMRVLEIGPGTGLFSSEAARRAAPRGQVIAVDVQPWMLHQLRRQHGATLPPSLQLVGGDAQRLPLANASCDAAVLIAVLPMIPARDCALHELRRVLRPGGTVLVSEDLMAPEYVPPAVTRHWLAQAGFAVNHQANGFWCYSVVAQREDAAHTGDHGSRSNR